MSFIEVKNIKYEIDTKENHQTILNDINLKINQGEFVLILGKSGSGKTTLLNIMVGITTPTSGNVIINNQDITSLTDDEKTYWRRYKVGYIFQNYGLFNIINVYDNIYLTLNLKSLYSHKAKKYIKNFKRNPKEDIHEVDDIMKKLNIYHLKDKFPHELSGGQQQRVSIARVFVKKPEIIFADEPTGALDYETGIEVMNYLKYLNDSGSTIVMITHNEQLKSYASKIIYISDGNILSIEDNNRG